MAASTQCYFEGMAASTQCHFECMAASTQCHFEGMAASSIYRFNFLTMCYLPKSELCDVPAVAPIINNNKCSKTMATFCCFCLSEISTSTFCI